MNDEARKILNEIKALETKLKKEVEEHEEELSYKIKNGFIEFKEEALKEQRENMKKLSTYLKEIPFLHLITSPLIYAMIIPALILDLTLFLFQQTVFRLYKFPLARRSDFIVFDRHHLNYLNSIEKLNCLYCSYFNGLMAYAVEIAGQTELYFCPIKHAKKRTFTHSKYKNFFDYGESSNYQKKLEELRESIKRG